MQRLAPGNSVVASVPLPEHGLTLAVRWLTCPEVQCPLLAKGNRNTLVLCWAFKPSNNKNVNQIPPRSVAVRIENRIVPILPSYHCPQAGDYLGDLASAILPKLDEFDSIWELANSICDRYLEPVAA